ncbi:MAG: ferredoxin family protein [Bacillota bacterium]
MDRKKCQGCDICIDFCPNGTYEMDGATGKPAVKNPYNCVIGCSGCKPECPSGAFSFPPLSILKDLPDQ